MNLNRLSIGAAAGLLMTGRAFAAGMCSLPTTNDGGGSVANAVNFIATISIGINGGLATNSISSGTVLGMGLQFVSRAGYQCFLSTNAPLGVAALPGTSSVQRLVPSANRTMTLEWTSNFNPSPVTYTVYFGTNPFALSVYAPGLSGTSQLLANLDYQTVYSWQVIVADQFGRTSPSNIYSFSIVPVIDHMIAAPNPFHPGRGATQFLFLMPGQGTADIEIFSLPDSRRVFHTQLAGLQDGANIYSYDGHDDGGRLLWSGVFSVRLNKHGANGNAVEFFKIVSVR